MEKIEYTGVLGNEHTREKAFQVGSRAQEEQWP